MMRLAGRIDPGRTAGPFTGQRLAASALSTAYPLRPPDQVLRGCFAGTLFAALDDVERGFVVVARGVPNESAALVFAVLFVVDGGDWALEGAAMSADASRTETINGCTTGSA